MLLEVCLVHYIVYEAGHVWHTCLVSCRIRTVKCKVELEVRELFLDFIVVLKIECLFETACSIEEVDLSRILFRLEQIHDMASHRGHTCASSDKD